MKVGMGVRINLKQKNQQNLCLEMYKNELPLFFSGH